MKRKVTWSERWIFWGGLTMFVWDNVVHNSTKGCMWQSPSSFLDTVLQKSFTHTPPYIRSTISPFSNKRLHLCWQTLWNNNDTIKHEHNFIVLPLSSIAQRDSGMQAVVNSSLWHFFFIRIDSFSSHRIKKKNTVLFTPLTLQRRWCNMTRRWHRNKYWREASWRQINEASSKQSLHL